jgi:AcrR family transcriptional regulator
MTAHLSVSHEKDDRIPPRERILAAAGDLFYRHGIRAVGVEAIAEAAGTNKMTLYRHFQSKDELVAEYLRQSAKAADACWDQLEQLHPGDELAQLGTWFREVAEHVADSDQRGCALANAAIELPEKTHPARRVIEDYKSAVRSRLVRLAQTAGLREPEMLADELFLLLEGARVSAQSGGTDGLGTRLARMGENLMAAHARR